MPIDPTSGVWIPADSPKQREIRRACRERTGAKKIILVDGPRKASKTRGCLHAIVEHAWHVKNSSVCVLCPSIPAGSSSGVWNELTERVIPEWIDGDFGLTWAPKEPGKASSNRFYTPQLDGATKKLFCCITNKWGGKSRIELNSLMDERDTEKLYHNRYFSMIYWSELSNTKKQSTFATILQSLRAYDVAQDDLVMLCDSNPDPELGDEHWAYKLFYDFRLTDNLPETRKSFQRCLRHIHITLDDNPYISETEKEEIRETYRSEGDPTAYACFAEGRWVKTGVQSSVFAQQFRPQVHVVETGGSLTDPEICVPEEDCPILSRGWDIGQSNHAVVFAEQIYVPFGNLLMIGFKFFDEVVIIKGVVDIYELTNMVMEKSEKWESYLGNPKLKWKDWSDRSSLDQRQSISNRFPYEEVIEASGGTIHLVGVENKKGTLAPSVRQWRKMLYQERLLFSQYGCPNLIAMNQEIKGRRGLRDSVDPDSPHKHVFDAGRYLVIAECYEELMSSIVRKGRLNKWGKRNQIVSVPL